MNTKISETQPAELSAIPTMDDALAAGDGTLHGAIEHWQGRALAAEAKLSEVSGDSAELAEKRGMEIPPLPDKAIIETHVPSGVRIRGYTAKQMHDYASAALAATGKQQVGKVPDGVWEALQRIIENSALHGPASNEDAILVARYRRDLLAARQPGAQEPFVASVQPEGSREAAMVVLERDGSGRPTVWCDPGVVDLVDALNGAGIATVWSCDGHGHRPATVGLKDGRQLLVLESLDALASISHLWPDINGNHSKPEPIGYANLHHLKDKTTDGVVVRKRSEFFTVPVYASPPAQGIDMGKQQDAARWRAIAPLLSVEWDEDEQLKRWTWIDFKGDAPAIPSHTREDYASVDAAIDALIGERDAAPGVK